MDPFLKGQKETPGSGVPLCSGTEGEPQRFDGYKAGSGSQLGYASKCLEVDVGQDAWTCSANMGMGQK